ncbi:vacuolar membrane protein [Colletotrichum truncatum]|uniref:Vacuolar membrane protein n=1 Tax=Colletotrichum truncatum TaxID=5467 RepID=A0ACC3ZIU8_COLTU|nr:vacuolar membrane protein [Colletotrichum truncatum]KAF6791849.1 vacuolar membrane protein [Colletotrichum truncatum]
MAPSEPMLPAAIAPDHGRNPRRSFSSADRLSASVASTNRSRSTVRSRASGLQAKLGLAGVARRTLGISLLLVTVLLWTVSNFLASYIFSDHSYDKPFFVVYMNTSVFAISLIPMLAKFLMKHGIAGLRSEAMVVWNEQKNGKSGAKTEVDEEDAVAGERLLIDDEPTLEQEGYEPKVEQLTFRETAIISLEFCMLWFFANYFASACLEYTSVGSVTILNSTSSVWTLVFCALMKVEGFTMRKFIGVLASLTGIVLISTVDLSGSSDENRGSFPHKTTAQIAIGDLMAFVSAIIYGLYVTVMKRRVGNEDRVNMPLFFGLVGLFNLVFLWPVFFILHFTGLEPFQLPPTGKIWTIVIANSLSSFVSDMSWAYAMLLTTPLVVTVGLSLTIPLSLIGEMIQYSQYSSWVYWVGAAVVLISFLFINHESHEDETGDKAPEAGSRAAHV